MPSMRGFGVCPGGRTGRSPQLWKLFPCRCKMAEIEQLKLDQLRALSNLDHLRHMVFKTFLPEGYGLPPEKTDNLRLAFDLARQYADLQNSSAKPVRV